jgi:hypothetical protein
MRRDQESRPFRDKSQPPGLNETLQLQMIFLSLGVLTVETNRYRDFLICRDQLLISVEIILTVETRFFLSPSRFLKSRLLSRDWAASRFQSRLSRLSRQIKICQHTPTTHDFLQRLLKT